MKVKITASHGPPPSVRRPVIIAVGRCGQTRTNVGRESPGDLPRGGRRYASTALCRGKVRVPESQNAGNCGDIPAPIHRQARVLRLDMVNASLMFPQARRRFSPAALDPFDEPVDGDEIAFSLFARLRNINKSPHLSIVLALGPARSRRPEGL